jgi:hypothetical protein
MIRRIPIDTIETSRQQRFNAVTMQAVARQSRITAVAMVGAANGMMTLARAARVIAREQLGLCRECRDAR